jgi:ketosteroid isomerase-like protein
MSQLWSFRDGRVCRIEVFPDAEGARSAARS